MITTNTKVNVTVTPVLSTITEPPLLEIIKKRKALNYVLRTWLSIIAILLLPVVVLCVGFPYFSGNQIAISIVGYGLYLGFAWGMGLFLSSEYSYKSSILLIQESLYWPITSSKWIWSDSVLLYKHHLEFNEEDSE